MVLKVLLDASILLAPFQLNINFEEWIMKLYGGQIEFYILENTLEELRRLSSRETSVGKYAKTVLSYSSKFKVLPKISYEGDEALVKAALRYGMAVATCDQALRKRLIKLKIPVFSIQGNIMRVDGLRC
ncbi:hypothetical protein B6U74_00755 [Candidatus Bathyarchaeota archaeon ex4484_205]|nr:MAG: hypothetical protein B6U74_00755 [Candidatus Bathyarchaeota archaeon ex4484_205]RLG67496.1 MAG: hypothetical protein DRN93_04435 [archaeon]